MKLSRKAKYLIAVILLLFLAAQVASLLIGAEGHIITVEKSAYLCPHCTVIQYQRKVNLFGDLSFEWSWHEPTELHKVSFADSPHVKSHDLNRAIFLQRHSKSLTLQQGFNIASWTNPWQVKVFSSRGTSVVKGQTVSGFPVHNHSAFVAAFSRLRTMDKTWADNQLSHLLGMYAHPITREFPFSLLPFATNKNEQALFELLQNTDLATEQPRDTNEFPFPR